MAAVQDETETAYGTPSRREVVLEGRALRSSGDPPGAEYPLDSCRPRAPSPVARRELREEPSAYHPPSLEVPVRDCSKT